MTEKRTDTIRVLVPGTFDPITLGHIDVITRSSQLFDEVVVGVAESKGKRGGPLFTAAERVELARGATQHLGNVEVRSFSNMLVDFAAEVGAVAVVKGLRVTTDFENEFQMAALNYRLRPDMETLFVMSNPEHMYVSSSMAKEIGGLGGSLEGIVSAPVATALLEKLSCGS